MRPLYTALVWLTVATHFAFLVYLLIGGFLALALRNAHRRVWSRRAIGLHVAVVLWGLGSVALHFWCPLTALEQWARPRAGMTPLGPSGFIDHYITGVFYPAGATGYVQAAAFTAVLVSWVLYTVTTRRLPTSLAGAR